MCLLWNDTSETAMMDIQKKELTCIEEIPICINWSLLFHVAIPHHDWSSVHLILHFYIHFPLIFGSSRIAAFPRVHLVNFEDIGWFKRIQFMEDWKWKDDSKRLVFGKRVSSINHLKIGFSWWLFESRNFRESILLHFSSGKYLLKEEFIKDWRWKESLKRLNHL